MKYLFPIEYKTLARIVIDAESPVEAAKKAKALFQELFEISQRDDSGVYGKETDKKFVFLEPYSDDNLLSVKTKDGWTDFDACGLETPKYEGDIDFEKEPEMRAIKFIWGMKSFDDLTDSDPNEYTMNDIDIIYDFKEKEYILSLEEIYQFETKEDQFQYFEHLQEEFKKYLISRGLPENELDDISECSAFKAFFPTKVIESIMPLKAKTLLDLYHNLVLFITMQKAVYSLLP